MDEFLKTPSIVRPHAEILLSPLDWGLGHASRIIPLLNTLLHLNCRLTIAANGPQKQLIREAFPALEFLSPPDYQVRYHKNRAATIASLALALPRLNNVIRQEADWVANLLEKRSFDLLISDNRYGFCHESRPSVFITHQLRPKTPFGAAADSLLQRQLYKYINRFTECWVPDYAEAPGLAGALSHPALKPLPPVRYLGPLTRIGRLPAPNARRETLVILSGPEPQRSILEAGLLERWRRQPGESLLLVRGLPEAAAIPAIPESPVTHKSPAIPELPPGIRIVNHLPVRDLQQQIANAAYILCRSGYSSLMDLLGTGKKLVLVPTPGQTEQEYLARLHQHPAANRWVVNQADLLHPTGSTRRVTPDGWI